MHLILRRFWSLGQSLQFKLMATTLLLTLSFIWGVVFYASTFLLDQQTSFLLEQQLSTSRLQAAELGHKLQDRLAVLETVGLRLDISRLADKSYATDFLAQRSTLQSQFSAGMIIFGPDGIALGDYPVLPGRRGANYADREYFQQAKTTGRPFISEPFMARIARLTIVTISVPILDASGAVRAVIIGNIDLKASNFLGLLSDPKMMGKLDLFLLSKKDRFIIASTDASRVMTKLPDSATANRLLASGDEAAFVAKNYRGIERIYAAKRVPSSDWILVTALPTEIAFQSIAHLRDRLYWTALLVTLLAIALFGSLVRRLLRPLRQAGTLMDAMSSGQQPLSRVTEGGDLELRRLLASFNRLSDSLVMQQMLLHQEQDKERDKLGLQVSLLQERLSIAADSAQIGIWEFQPATGKLIWNNWMYALYGIDESDFSGAYDAWMSGVHPDDKVRCQEEIDRAIQSNDEFDTEFRVIWPSGEIRSIKAASVVVRDVDGQPLRMVGVNYDITHLIRDQESLRQATGIAEAANLAKSAFIANMSHEIRTPMNAILGLAYILDKMALSGDANELVCKIRMAGRSLLGIINDILDFSKIESGKLEIEQAPFHLDDVIDNLATIMAASAGDKELELIIAPPPRKLGQLRGDALRLGQVLINLTSNAIKFTERGVVNVLISVIEESEHRVTLHFAVRDTGIGIAPQVQQEIFAPFSQADGSTSRRFGGTGLGLTISHKLVAAMGGELGVQSEIGKGSEFGFTLEFEREPEITLSAPEMANFDVVIADDNTHSLEALRNIIQTLGWTASAFNSGETALLHVAAQHDKKASRQIFLLDWQMPGGMDGLATGKAIRDQIKDTQDPLIIMVTAGSRDELLAQADSHLVDAVLTKPLTPSALYNAVATALQVRNGVKPALPGATLQRLAGLRIQVVDDSDINRAVALRIFGDEGAHVVLACDGRQALDWLQAHPDDIDIVLMDVQMPVMDGYEATRAIRRMPALAQLPVLALTAGNFIEIRTLADEAGMNGFVAKPFDVDAAIALILKLTGRADSVHAMPDTSPEIGHDRSHDLPGLAVGRGLTVWKDPLAYRQYLRKFARDYAGIVVQMATSESAASASLAHKLSGAAGSLALHEVCALAGEAERALRAGADRADSVARLQNALETALQSIERYAPPAAPLDATSDTLFESARSASFDPAQVAVLLAQMLAACDTDSLRAVRPVLAELDKLLPPSRLAAIHTTLQEFDLRGAEVATRALAGALNMSLDT